MEFCRAAVGVFALCVVLGGSWLWWRASLRRSQLEGPDSLVDCERVMVGEMLCVERVGQ